MIAGAGEFQALPVRSTIEAARQAEAAALAFQRGGPPLVRRLVARRRDARFALDASERGRVADDPV